MADDRRLMRSGADSASVCCGEERARYKSETALCRNQNNEKG